MDAAGLARAFLGEGYATAWELMADSSRLPAPLDADTDPRAWSRSTSWAQAEWVRWAESLPIVVRTPLAMRALSVRDAWPAPLRGEGSVALVGLAFRNFPAEARALAERWTARVDELTLA